MAERAPEAPGRRRLLGWLTRGFLSLWAFGFAWVVFAFLKPPRSRQSLTDRLIRVGPLDSLPPGTATLVRHGREPIWVIRTGDDALVGLAGVCTHLHCVLDWDAANRVLDCPCHNGSFDLNGNVLSGPPPEPLTRYRVETRRGEIYVHL